MIPPRGLWFHPGLSLESDYTAVDVYSLCDTVYRRGHPKFTDFYLAAADEVQKPGGGCRCRWRLPQALPPPASVTFAAGIAAASSSSSLINVRIPDNWLSDVCGRRENLVPEHQITQCADSAHLAIRMSVKRRVFPQMSGKLPGFG